MSIVVGSWWLIYVFFLHSFKTYNPPLQGIYQNHWSFEWRLFTLESPNTVSLHSSLSSRFTIFLGRSTYVPSAWHGTMAPLHHAMLLRSMVDNQQSSHAKSINLSKIHQAFATTSDLLFAYAMPWYGHQQPTAILWTSCCFSSQSRLSSLAHWLIVEGEPLQGLQRIGRSWHLPRVDQVSSGHLP